MCIESWHDIDGKNNNRRTFFAHEKVRGMYLSLFSRVRGQGGESGKMSVICLSESAEVLTRGLEYSITCAAAEMVQRSQALAQLQLPPPPTVSHFFALSLFCSCAVFSHSLIHISLFLGLSPLCLTIFLSLWFSQCLQSSISLLLHFPSNYIYSASLCYSQTPLITVCIHHPPLLICWPWFCLHNLRHKSRFPVISLTTLIFLKDSSKFFNWHLIL